MRQITQLFLLALGLTACSSTPSTQPDTVSKNIFAITDVTIIDVKNGIAIPGQTVIIVDSLIDKIGTQGKVRIPKGAELIDGRGLYLMPGLVDAHVHYLEAPGFGRLMIANGVLLVRDMGMPNEYILKLRDELNRGDTLGPEMIATGAMLDGVPPIIPTISIGIKTPEEGRAAVREQAAAGVDEIKVYSRLDRDIFLAIVDEAKKIGIKVVGHVPDTIYIEDAAAAGLQSSEHWNGFDKVIATLLGEPVKLAYSGYGAGFDYLLRLGEVDPGSLQEVYQRLHASGVTICPTVVTFKNFPDVDALEVAGLPMGEYVSRNLLSMWKSQWAGQTELPDLFWQNWAQMVKEMNKAGILLMIGTDLMVPGIIPGYSVHEEMTIWQEAGIPAADILRSATLVPAQFMGLGDRLGSVAEGKAASVILVRENPLEDVRNAQQIEGVFLRGQYFNLTDLDILLEEARNLALQPAP